MGTYLKAKKGVIHIQRSTDIALCGHKLSECTVILASEPTCKKCIKLSQQEVHTEKTCTVCGFTKDIGDFYYDVALDRVMSKCTKCASRYTVVYRQYKRIGKKLTTKEFREKKLYREGVLV